MRKQVQRWRESHVSIQLNVKGLGKAVQGVKGGNVAGFIGVLSGTLSSQFGVDLWLDTVFLRGIVAGNAGLKAQEALLHNIHEKVRRMPTGSS